jgi:hypothetical protein
MVGSGLGEQGVLCSEKGKRCIPSSLVLGLGELQGQEGWFLVAPLEQVIGQGRAGFSRANGQQIYRNP